MATVQVLYWHDIPTQVRAKAGRERSSVALSPRFMEAVDRAAMRARHTGPREYAGGFHWGPPEERAGTPQEVAAAVAADIEAQYQKIDWVGTADRLRGKGD